MSRSLLGAVVVACLLLTGCTSLEGTGDKGYIDGDGSVQFIDEGDRSDPIEVTGTALTGEAIDTSDYLGRVVVINAWWSGCGPCRTEMPMLAEASADLGPSTAFLGINIRDNSESQSLAFVRGVGADYPSIYDPSGKAMLAFSGTVSLSRTPSTVVLDQEGRVAAVIAGEIPSKLTLTDVVEDVAGDAGASADG